MRRQPPDSPIKDADPAEGSRDNVNIPIETDEASEAEDQRTDRSTEREAITTTPAERDEETQAPDADRRGHPRTTL